MSENQISLDDTDRRLINRIQSDFPLTSRPFLAIGEELGLTEKDVISRITRLKENGIIRRIGGNFVPGKLGFVSTLCAAQVPENKLAHFTETVNRYPGVTHNYRRENEFNIWFTFIASSREDIHRYLEDISRKTGVEKILNMPATRVFKINAQFDL
jgi:DNA-binding Lrp family transcriptional regulator